MDTRRHESGGVLVRGLFGAGDEIFPLRRSEDEIESEPHGFRERITDDRDDHGEDRTAVLQRIPRGIRPSRNHHDDERCGEGHLDTDQIQSVSAEEVIAFPSLEKNSTAGAALLQSEVRLEDFIPTAVRAAAARCPPKESGGAFPRRVGCRSLLGLAGVLAIAAHWWPRTGCG
jgi:hypothetical protein